MPGRRDVRRDTSEGDVGGARAVVGDDVERPRLGEAVDRGTGRGDRRRGAGHRGRAGDPQDRRPRRSQGRRSMRYTWALKHRPYTLLVWWRSEGMAILTPHTLDASGHTEISSGQSKWNWRRRIAMWALVGRADRSGREDLQPAPVAARGCAGAPRRSRPGERDRRRARRRTSGDRRRRLQRRRGCDDHRRAARHRALGSGVHQSVRCTVAGPRPCAAPGRRDRTCR